MSSPNAMAQLDLCFDFSMQKTYQLYLQCASVCLRLSRRNFNKQETLVNPNFNPEQMNVYSTIEKMVAAFQAKDIDGVLEAYEDGAAVMFEPQKPVSGKDALRMVFSQAAGIDPKYTFGGHEICVTGDIATHIAPWSMTGRLPDGTKIEQSGLSVAVLRKQADGRWLMVQDNPHGQFLLGTR
jgi:ketosteroid isomerase-like protein